MPMLSISRTVSTFSALAARLLSLEEEQKKIDLLLSQPQVQGFLKKAEPVRAFIDHSDSRVQLALLSVIAIGEGEVVFRGWNRLEGLEARLESLAEKLGEVDRFYDTLGGIVGYHATVLRLIHEKDQIQVGDETYLQPPKIDIAEENPEVFDMIRWGVEGLPSMAEIYPVGGAGDRLNLLDSETGQPLPAAELRFCGRTLLESLLRDLQSREMLYTKLTGQSVTTPVVLMTSVEKDNDQRIRQICESQDWFGRPRDSFFFVVQPLVPVVTIEGHWVMKSEFELFCKPGGHGVIWKLMEDQGVFDWMKSKGRTKALLRQINNPIAGVDYGLLAFTGIGCRQDKAFGFASCPRAVNASEGMDVLVEKKTDKGFGYSISNIEYTDFSQKGIEDIPEHEGSDYSLFPANTNILFVDLEKVRSLVPLCPVPGMLVNLKNKANYISAEGDCKLLAAGRLESTMQNIADWIVAHFDRKISDSEMAQLPSYLTYNKRNKTITVTKRSYEPSKPFDETPERCFYTLLTLNRNVCESHCKMIVPPLASEAECAHHGPNVLILFHPALGPLYHVIGQKIRGGQIAEGSELQVDLAEVDIENLSLTGSLLIAGNSERGTCFLRNVVIENFGINRTDSNQYWKGKIERKEAFEVVLEGHSSFIAQNVILRGNLKVVVPDGYQVTAVQEGGDVVFHEEKMEESGDLWHYFFGNSGNVELSQKKR
jgi:UTP---glucose-1-phosphate uridylyltransferase